VLILEQMAAWTEEATFAQPAADPAALRPVASEGLSISGVPWVTIVMLLSALWMLLAASGLRSSVGLHSLLLYGAKATPLILDRGETWRLFAANLLHKDPLHLAFNAFALWNVGGALERAVRPADYLALLIFTALGTTLVSAIGADSISLGASGMAFGVPGASGVGPVPPRPGCGGGEDAARMAARCRLSQLRLVLQRPDRRLPQFGHPDPGRVLPRTCLHLRAARAQRRGGRPVAARGHRP